MTTGDKIRTLREAAHLTQAELGARCGTTKQTIFKYETGVISNIPLDKIRLIADALNVDPAVLLGWVEPEAAAENKKDAPAVSESVNNLVELISQLTPENQETLAAVARGLLLGQSDG